jgi:uncharacterized delta-60 repeat protein/uncharacterized repeat protein (TIGR01451 family)
MPILVAAIIVLLRPVAAWTAAGDLDPAFGGTNGTVVLDVGGEGEEALALALQPDGRFVVGGAVYTGSTSDLLIARFLPDGSPDVTFSSGILVWDVGSQDSVSALTVKPDGTIVTAGTSCSPTCEAMVMSFEEDGGTSGPLLTSFAAGESHGSGVALQADEKVVVAGFWRNGTHWDVGLLRQLPDGTLDPDFGLSGTVTFGTPIADEFAGGVAVQPDGKIVVAGDTCTAGSCQMLVVRFLPDGTLDPTFGAGGVVTVAVGPVTSSATSLVLQADGRIVAAGTARGDLDHDVAVIRLNGDGSLDPTFGTGGTVVTSIGDGEDAGSALAIHPGTGAITVAGYTCADAACTAGAHIGVVRYLADGSLDPVFGASGLVTTAISADDAADAVAILPDGEPLVAGTTLAGSSYDVALVRYRVDGTADPTFGGGAVTTALGPEDSAWAAALQPDGKIVAAGGGLDMVVARYGPDGTLDPTFGAGGTTVVAPGQGLLEAVGVAVQGDGRLVLAGRHFSGSVAQFAVVRTTAGGVPDAGFGTAGVVTTPFPGGDADPHAVALQPDGKIVMAGLATSATGADFALARYLPDGTLDPGFGTGGMVTTSIGADYDEAWALCLQPDGRIVAAGASEAPGYSQIALVRYLADGSPDPTFGAAGIVTTAPGGGTSSYAAYGCVLQPDGAIVVAGESDGAIVVARYAADGSLDPGFGAGGIVTTPLDDSFARAVTLQAGRIVVAGSGTNTGAGDFVVARYQSDGTLDPAFGAGGTRAVTFGVRDDEARAVLVQPDGNLVVVGRSSYNGVPRFALARLVGSSCPNGAVEAGEQCDDGNAATGDGCDALCRGEESVSVPVAAGGSGTSDPEADGATPGDPVETTVTSPNAGTVTILETSVTDTAPPSFRFFDRQVSITAPPATPADPLELVFRIDASVVPSGEDESTIQLFRDGVLVPPCTGGPAEALPDPCVSGRARVGDDVEITVLSSAASDWTLGVASCATVPRTGCSAPPPGKGKLVLKNATPDTRDSLGFTAAKLPATPVEVFGAPATGTPRYLLCVYDESYGAPSLRLEGRARAGSSCGGRDCWTATGGTAPTGQRYRDRERMPDGLEAIGLRAGNAAQVTAKAKGAALSAAAPELLTLPLVLPVRVQLQAAGGACWEAVYDATGAKRNDAKQFKGISR